MTFINMINIINKYKYTIFLTFIFLLLAIIYTWPIAIHFKNSVYARAGDPYGMIYNFWQMKDGIINYSFPNTPIYTLFAYIGVKIFGEIVTYNAFILASYLFTSLSCYILANKILKNSLGAFFASLILILMPFRLTHSLQHLNFADLSGLLFFIYFLICAKEKPNFKNIFLSGLFFVLTTLWNYQYGFFAGIILLVYIVFLILSYYTSKPANPKKVVFKFDKKITYYILITTLFTILVIGIFNYKVFTDYQAIRNGKTTEVVPIRSGGELKIYSAKWFYYLYPSPDNPIFGKLTRAKYDQVIQDLGTNRTEQTLYLGWIPILLMAYGLWQTIKLKMEDGRRKTNVWFFVLLGLVGLALSFSDTWSIFGISIKSPAQYIFDYLPFFRVYARFGLLVAISVAILAGIGLTMILDRMKKPLFKTLLLVTCYLLLIMEFLNFPPNNVIGVDYKSMPEVYKQVSQITGDIKIVNYPLLPEETPQGYDYLLWERIHQKKSFNQDFYKFSSNDQKNVLDPNSNDSLNILKKYDVSYLVIRGDKYLNGDLKYYPVNYNSGKIPDLSDNPNYQLINTFGNDMLYKINN